MNWQRGLTGCLEIMICGEHPQRVINMALTRGIHIWDIRQKEADCYLLKIRVGGYKALRHLVRRSSCRMRIVKKGGLFFYIIRAKRRKVLVLGILFFFVMLYTLSSFVWSVEISGNKKVEKTVIEEVLRGYGLKCGVPKSALDYDEIRDRLLIDVPELSWAGIRVQGTKVIVEVAEKTLIPEDDETKPADIVAKAGGRIEGILILTGTPLVKDGDIVEKGQVLVYGLSYPIINVSENGTLTPGGVPEQVRARAVVRAKVRRSVVAQCPIREEKDYDTGAETTVTILRFRNRDIVLMGPTEAPYERFRVVSHVKKLSWGRIPEWSVELITMVYREQRHEVFDWGLAGAYDEALTRAKEVILKELPADHRIIAEEHEPLLAKQNDLIRVKYSLETIEDIVSYRKRQ